MSLSVNPSHHALELQGVPTGSSPHAMVTQVASQIPDQISLVHILIHNRLIYNDDALERLPLPPPLPLLGRTSSSSSSSPSSLSSASTSTSDSSVAPPCV